MESMSLDISQNPSGLSNEDILKFPFPYKLWIVISLPNTTCLYWHPDGNILQVNLRRLQEYLCSMHSIFVTKTSSKFLKHLEDFEFKRLDGTNTSESAETVLSFQHEHFQRHRLDLVAKICRTSLSNLDSAQNAEKEGPTSSSSVSFNAARMSGDLCFMEHGFLTEIQKKRIQSETIFAFARESRVLQEKLKVSAAGNLSSNNKRGRSACLEKEQILVLPRNLYENPHESDLAGKGGIQGSKYGGYYGNCTEEQINAFFGDYLPKFSEDGVLKVKNFKDSSRDNSHQITSNQADNETESSLPMSVVTLFENAIGNIEENSMNVENFVRKQSIDATNPFTTSNINVSATFDCNNGSMEYNITECPKEDILAPRFEELKEIPISPLNEVGTSIVQVLTENNPGLKHEEEAKFYDDFGATFDLLQKGPF